MLQPRQRAGEPDTVARDRETLRFLFVTLQHIESSFYGSVGEHLRAAGHEVSHLTFSRRSAAVLRRRGMTAYVLPELIADLDERACDLPAEVRRIESTYDTPTLRDIYRTDIACEGRPDDWCVARTVRHVLAMEQVFDTAAPDVVIPEVGSETLRTVAHLLGLERGIPVLFLFYTIFDDPLRLYVDQMHRPIVPRDELRRLDAAERSEVEDFIARFTERREPIRAYRRASVTANRAALWARHVAVRASVDRDNDYLTPTRWIVRDARERLRASVARRFYSPLESDRPFLYFPLHVTDDYKIQRIIPHCMNQASLVEQVAGALPQGYDLVVKEHPMSIGRTPVELLRRLADTPNVRIVQPYTSSHEIVQRSSGVTVISSTVGLEALLYGKPVLTLGEPFYGGYGMTLDVPSFAEIRESVPALLEFRPDRELILRFLHAAMRRCYPGAPALVDQSAENAERLARSVDRAAREELARRARRAVAAV